MISVCTWVHSTIKVSVFPRAVFPCSYKLHFAGFEVLTAVLMYVCILSDKAP
jgi:hypothetical protein